MRETFWKAATIFADKDRSWALITGQLDTVRAFSWAESKNKGNPTDEERGQFLIE